jgi:hypothetical protein
MVALVAAWVVGGFVVGLMLGAVLRVIGEVV